MTPNLGVGFNDYVIITLCTLCSKIYHKAIIIGYFCVLLHQKGMETHMTYSVSLYESEVFMSSHQNLSLCGIM